VLISETHQKAERLFFIQCARFKLTIREPHKQN